MKQRAFFILILLINFGALNAQWKVRQGTKVEIGVNINLETYFIAERLAIEHIEHFVFDNKDMDYSHQPIVSFAFREFESYKDFPVIIKIGDILKTMRDSLHDNGPIMEYLVNQPAFNTENSAKIGHGVCGQTALEKKFPTLAKELRDSLASFHKTANVQAFLEKNKAFYDGAIREFAQDVDADVLNAMEQFYGRAFLKYILYISPAMPIPPGEDNYRGYGPQIFVEGNSIAPAMIVSSSVMLKPERDLLSYTEYGFANPAVTQFIYSHEIGHSFINPLLEEYAPQIKRDSALYTKELAALLEPHYINDWYVCVTEHLVRLGEIRTAVHMGKEDEANRLRKLHINEYKCVLLPLLEKQILEYEENRSRYPTFEDYLSNLIGFFHRLTSQDIDEVVKKYKDGVPYRHLRHMHCL